MSVIHQPHDKFIRLSLGQLRVAQEFFTEHLPATVLENINLATLKLENRSFIDENYKGTEADIVYSVSIAGTAAYLYLLCEHQSTVDDWIAFRLWVYMVRLMEMHRKQNPEQPLPLIYPMVIYTGQEIWNAPLDIFPLFGDQNTLAREWLFKPFQLLDIHQIPDDEMRQRQWCGLVEFALKHKKAIDFKQFLKTLLPWINQVEQTSSAGFSFSNIVLKYVLDGTESKDFDLFIQEVQEYLSKELRGEIMTLAQELERRGEQRGISQGLNQGIDQGMRQGLNLGIQQGEVALITRQLQRRFNKIPESYLARIQQADAETLLLWGEKILDANTLEEVFEEI